MSPHIDGDFFAQAAEIGQTHWDCQPNVTPLARNVHLIQISESGSLAEKTGPRLSTARSPSVLARNPVDVLTDSSPCLAADAKQNHAGESGGE